MTGRAAPPVERGTFVSRWTRAILDPVGPPDGAAGASPADVQIEAPSPRKGQTWVTPDGARSCRVMCSPVDGWLMARCQAEAPWVMRESEFVATFKPRPRPAA